MKTALPIVFVLVLFFISPAIKASDEQKYKSHNLNVELQFLDRQAETLEKQAKLLNSQLIVAGFQLQEVKPTDVEGQISHYHSLYRQWARTYGSLLAYRIAQKDFLLAHPELLEQHAKLKEVMDSVKEALSKQQEHFDTLKEFKRTRQLRTIAQPVLILTVSGFLALGVREIAQQFNVFFAIQSAVIGYLNYRLIDTYINFRRANKLNLNFNVFPDFWEGLTKSAANLGYEVPEMPKDGKLWLTSKTCEDLLGLAK